MRYDRKKLAKRRAKRGIKKGTGSEKILKQGPSKREDTHQM